LFVAQLAAPIERALFCRLSSQADFVEGDVFHGSMAGKLEEKGANGDIFHC
jgi:hypothetical protein